MKLIKNFYFDSLAKSQQLDQDGLIDIFTQYGDHLYSKGDHDGAIDQYIKTIGKLEASYVIRKVCFSYFYSLVDELFQLRIQFDNRGLYCFTYFVCWLFFLVQCF